MSPYTWRHRVPCRNSWPSRVATTLRKSVWRRGELEQGAAGASLSVGADGCPVEVGPASQGVPTHQIARDYLNLFRHILEQIDLDALARVVEQLRTARDRGATIYIAGNGGSAATAAHLANDLGKATKRSGCRPIRVMSLSDNVPWLTALANDEGYERVFSGQLENFARLGDVLIVISASGNSQNLVNAVEFARAHGITTVGVLGFDGGTLMGMVDECLWLESAIGVYGPVESGQMVVCDLVTTCLIADRPDRPEADGAASV
jgi:D-sedoheptulose 7-phosphate isomerase